MANILDDIKYIPEDIAETEPLTTVIEIKCSDGKVPYTKSNGIDMNLVPILHGYPCFHQSLTFRTIPGQDHHMHHYRKSIIGM